MTPLHAQARRFAEAGIKIFPCLEDAKQPATEHGFKDASDDPAQIERWWTENPNYNIAICPEDAGWYVIDIDPGGEGSWIEAIKDGGGHPPTYEVATPRGGRHLYFNGSIPSSAGKLGAHVDTRGVGGYVLVPPSVVGGKSYGVTNDRAIADGPAWIASRLAARNSRVDGPDEGSRDTVAILARATDYLCRLVERKDIARSGHGGNDKTFGVFAWLKDLGVSREVALRLVLETGWNDACEPPWPMGELIPIAEHAFKYAQNTAGTNDVGASAADTFGKTAAFQEAMKANKVRPSRYRLMSLTDFRSTPEPAWIVPELIPEDALVLWMGASQSFKSFLLLDLLLGVAAGKPTFGCTPEPGPVLYGAIEDLINIGKKRANAWTIAREMPNEPIENFRASDVPFLGMTQGEEAEWFAGIETWLAGRKMKLVAIDTAGKTMAGYSENKSEDVRLFGAFCSRLRDAFGCTVIVVHHMGKDADRGARGSSAWLADFDSVIEIVRPDKALLNVEAVARKHKNAEDGKRWPFKGIKLAGSLVFSQATAAEHREAQEHSDFYAPTKIGKALIAANAHTRATALMTPTLHTKLGGTPGDEAGVRKLEKLSRLTLKVYCELEDGVLYWWFNETPGGVA